MPDEAGFRRRLAEWSEGLKFEDLPPEVVAGAKRPAHGGIPASAAASVVGRRLRRQVEQDEQIRDDDLD